MKTIIRNETHSTLLYLLDRLPYDEANILRKELEETYGDYQQHLITITDTTKQYETIAQKVRARASQHKRQQETPLKELAVNGKE